MGFEGLIFFQYFSLRIIVVFYFQHLNFQIGYTYKSELLYSL